MKYYKYETHLHTSEVSACARASAAEQAEFYARRGYAGIIVTDHFFNGNTTVPRSGLSWEEMVEKFCVGYENAKKVGNECGLDVFFAWEYSYLGTDFLTYGFSPEWLLSHPEIMELDHRAYCEHMMDLGGLVIHAHPYREAGYIKEIRLIPRSVDGVEVTNANRTDFENARAREYAKNYSLIPSAGSDNHNFASQKKLAGIKTPRRLADIGDFIYAMRHGEYKIFSEKVE